MKTIATLFIAALFLVSCKTATTTTTQGDATTAFIEPAPVIKSSIDTSKPETIVNAAVKDDDTKKRVEEEIKKRNIDTKDTDSLLNEAKKHLSEEDLEMAVKKLKSAIGGYGE
jgi:PBP1b-binding outer membrane lipoprotein LpoB